MFFMAYVKASTLYKREHKADYGREKIEILYEDEWLVVGDSFEEFRKKLNPMRCINHSGEVAEYVMILSLNQLGKSFLKVDGFVSQNQPYTETRPKGEK